MANAGSQVKGKLTVSSGGVTVTGTTTLDAVTFNGAVSGLTVSLTGQSCTTLDTNSQGNTPAWWTCPDTADGRPRFIHELELYDHSNVGGDGTLIYDIKCCTVGMSVQ